MISVDYFLTPVSPWVYMAGTRPARIAARHGATLVYRPVDPGGVFSRTGGLALPDRHPSRQAYRLQELRRWSAALGMPLNLKPRHFPTNPAPASYALIAAQAAGGGDLAELLAAMGRAVWAEERNLAEDAVIRDCLSAAGFDPALADKGLLAGAEEYGRNTEQAVLRGAFGFPFFLVGDEAFWGQDRLDMFEAHLAALAAHD